MVSNEHPEALERLLPTAELETKVKGRHQALARRTRDARHVHRPVNAPTVMPHPRVAAYARMAAGYSERSDDRGRPGRPLSRLSNGASERLKARLVARTSGDRHRSPSKQQAESRP